MKVLVSWSTGKDSAWMLHMLNQQYPQAAAGLLTTTNQAFDRVAMHAVRRTVLERQAEAAGLPLHVIPLPWPCSNADYEARIHRSLRAHYGDYVLEPGTAPEQVVRALDAYFDGDLRALDNVRTAIAGLVTEGFTHVAFGDLFLDDVRLYREERLAGTGLEPLFPIWKTKSTHALAHEMIDAGLKARLTCIDPRKLDRSFAGRTFDHALLNDLPSDVDPCGENGEFHSFACAGPMFTEEIKVKVGEIVDRDGFVFSDLTLSS